MSAAATHHEEMLAAVDLDARGQSELLAGDQDAARASFRLAAVHYRTSWELASATSYGRLVGMLKAAVLAGDADQDAAYAADQLAQADADSPTAAYVRALAALIMGNDGEASRWAAVMARTPGPFARAASGISAITRRDAAGLEAAVAEVVDDFERRSEHLTGVAIADTALMLDVLALRRGMEVRLPSSAVLPAP